MTRCEFTDLPLFAAWGLLPLVVVLTFVYGRNLLRWTAVPRSGREGAP